MGFWQSYFHDLFALFFSEQFLHTVIVIWGLFPFWGPVLFAVVFYNLWINYVRAKFLSQQPHVLLEIRLPREVYKSPLAMELALSGFFVTSGESNWYDTNVYGKVRAYFSLEIASFGGNIHFYVWTRVAYRPVVEAQLYGQYPDIEIFEVEDYTKSIPPLDNKSYFLVGQDYKLDKEDAYPIKSYVDYGLDKDPKEEFKIDPLTSVLEYLATLKRSEQIWIQFIIQAHKTRRKSAKTLLQLIFPQKTDIQSEAKALIHKLLEELREESPNVLSPEAEESISYRRFPTRGEVEVMAAIDRHAGKLNFDVGIRLVYLAKPEDFQAARVPQTFSIFRAYSTKNMNSLNLRWGPYFDFWWEDFRSIRANWRRKELFDGYRLRSYFHPPIKNPPMILSSEELASLYHFPGGVLQVPSIARVMSKKAEAPPNLPQ